MKIACVIFDLDGTLVDTAGDITASLNYTLKRLKFPMVTESDVMDFIGDGMHSLLSKATGRTEPEFIERGVRIYRAHYARHCCDLSRPYPGVSRLLGELSGHKMGIVTNKIEKISLKIIKKLGIFRQVRHVFGGDTLLNRKPHPEPVEKMMKLLACRPDQTLFVGDSPTDIQAGHNAGAFTCAVTYGYKSRSELAKLKPDFTIGKFSELRRILKP